MTRAQDRRTGASAYPGMGDIPTGVPAPLERFGKDTRGTT